MLLCGEIGIRTPGTSRFNGFQDRRNRPLCHLSNKSKLTPKPFPVLLFNALTSLVYGCKSREKNNTFQIFRNYFLYFFLFQLIQSFLISFKFLIILVL